MNTKSIRFILGWILNIEALLMLLPVATAVVYREEEGIAYALVYLTPLGANAIWWSIPAGWAVGAAVSLLRVKSGKWMRTAVADR